MTRINVGIPPIELVDKHLMGDYKPTERDRRLLQERISERLNN